jgi:hypothetical protein
MFTTNPTWAEQAANLDFRGDSPASNRLSHGTAFRGPYCLHRQGDEYPIMKAVMTCETSVNSNEATRCNIPVDRLHTHTHENLESTI